jgi:hypothetical protein
VKARAIRPENGFDYIENSRYETYVFTPLKTHVNPEAMRAGVEFDCERRAGAEGY